MGKLTLKATDLATGKPLSNLRTLYVLLFGILSIVLTMYGAGLLAVRYSDFRFLNTLATVWIGYLLYSLTLWILGRLKDIWDIRYRKATVYRLVIPHGDNSPKNIEALVAVLEPHGWKRV
jgi:hypothetical protein